MGTEGGPGEQSGLRGISQSRGEDVRAEQGPRWWLCREPWTSELLLKELRWDAQGWAQPLQ